MITPNVTKCSYCGNTGMNINLRGGEECAGCGAPKEHEHLRTWETQNIVGSIVLNPIAPCAYTHVQTPYAIIKEVFP